MTSELPIQCWACKRLQTRGFRCEAFPDRIPNSILSGADHRVPVEGDHGLQFSQRDSAAARDDFKRWQEVFGDSGSGQ